MADLVNFMAVVVSLIASTRSLPTLPEMWPIVSIERARKILGKNAENMTDREIEELIETLDLLAKDALQEAKRRIVMKKDAKALAELTYDIYKDSKPR